MRRLKHFFRTAFWYLVYECKMEVTFGHSNPFIFFGFFIGIFIWNSWYVLAGKYTMVYAKNPIEWKDAFGTFEMLVNEVLDFMN